MGGEPFAAMLMAVPGVCLSDVVPWPCVVAGVLVVAIGAAAWVCLEVASSAAVERWGDLVGIGLDLGLDFEPLSEPYSAYAVACSSVGSSVVAYRRIAWFAVGASPHFSAYIAARKNSAGVSKGDGRLGERGLLYRDCLQMLCLRRS